LTKYAVAIVKLFIKLTPQKAVLVLRAAFLFGNGGCMGIKTRPFKFYVSNLNPKTAKQLSKIDKIIRKTSDKDKLILIENGLSVKSKKADTIATVDIKQIVHSAYFIRSKQGDTFDNFDFITKLDPIKVVVANEIAKYFLIDGQGRLQHAKRRGEKKVQVQIIGTVVCQSQIGMARGKEMVKFKRFLTPLELAQGLMQLKDQIISDFGEGAFFSHGGDRKTNHETKQSLPCYIAKVLGITKTTVDSLLRFGSNVGPMGLAGLLTKNDMIGMPLRDINQINARLKNGDLSEQISERAKKLVEAGANQDHLIDEAGELARKRISQAIDEGGPADNDNDNDDNEDETDSSDLPPMPKLRKSKEDENDDEVEEAKPPKKKIKPAKIVKIISDIQMELKKIKEDFEDCKHIDEIDQRLVEAKWKRLEGYWGELCGKLGDAGLC
jgi:hypothetical protein